MTSKSVKTTIKCSTNATLAPFTAQKVQTSSDNPKHGKAETSTKAIISSGPPSHKAKQRTKLILRPSRVSTTQVTTMLAQSKFPSLMRLARLINLRNLFKIYLPSQGV
jgi:hypothetical protein